MGFVPRTGVDNGELFIGGHFRPERIRKWAREIFPHFQIENFSRRKGAASSRATWTGICRSRFRTARSSRSA